MTTVIIDTRSKEAKRLLNFLKTVRYVKVIEETSADSVDNDPQFVEMINQRKEQTSVKLDIPDLWK
jgi:hypothetical protein